MNSRGLSLALFLIGIATPAGAFDLTHSQKTTLLGNRYLTLGTDIAVTGFNRTKGLSGDTGFGFRMSVGHVFNRYLSAEINYQLTTFEFQSPDPVAPTTGFVDTSAWMNQEMIRVIATYPASWIQPYASLGFGGYNWFSVATATALSFPVDIVVPVAAGIRTYVLRDILSVNAEFSYQFIFGENQSADTLQILGLNEVQFDTYSVLIGVTWYLL